MNEQNRVENRTLRTGIITAFFCALALSTAWAQPPILVGETNSRAEFRQVELTVTAADGSERVMKRQVPARSAAAVQSPIIQAIDYDQMVTPDVIVGSGIANGEFTTDRRNGIELALRGALRFNAQGDPENTFNSNGDGSYSFAAGQAPGESPQTAVWSFHWSVNTDFDNSSGLNLDDLVYEMGLDADPGLGTDFLIFDPVTPGISSFFDHAIGDNSTPNGGGTVANDSTEYLALLANNPVAQNSWRYDFFPIPPLDSFDPEADGRYNVYLSAIDPNTDEVLAHVEIVFLIGDAPSEMHVQSTALTGDTPTATDNDFTRINNAIQAATSDSVITLEGTFDWTELHATQSWIVAGYGSPWPADVHRVTLTAAALGDAVIQGPGDIPELWWEGVFYAYGPNQGWEISNLSLLDFDLSIGMFYAGGGVHVFDGTRIINNHIRTSTDLAIEYQGSDIVDFQNIAIHYSLGDNQLIAGNLIEIPGDGVGDTNAGFSSATHGIQSTTSGSAYEGLVIEDNVVRVLNAQSAEPEYIVGIWENGAAHNRNITVRNNVFENLAAGNDPLLNRQQGFRLHSQSSATTEARWEGNSVSGANVGYQWLPAHYGAGLNREPVVFEGNSVSNTHIGVQLDSNGAGRFRDNDFSGADIGILNATTGPRESDATCNWWGSPYGPSGEGPGFGAAVDENVLFEPWNSSLGGDCDGQFTQPGDVYVDDDYAGLPPGTAVTFTFANSSTINATVGYDAFAALADGISAVANSGTVFLASGDYPGGRLVIDKYMQIEGVGDKPVVRPNQNMTGSAASDAWILVEEGAILNLANVAFDGDSHHVHYGLRSHGVLFAQYVDVRNIHGGSPYLGVGVASFGGVVAGGAGAGTYSESSLHITESSFEQIGRIAVLVKGSESTGQIYNSVFSGKGEGDFLDYAVEVGAEGTAVIDGNTISGNRGIASSDGSTSAGILVTSYYGNTASEATISNNNLVDNSHGIAVGYGDNDDNYVSIVGNNFIGNRYQLSVSYNDFDLVEDTLADNDFDRAVVVRDNPIAVPAIYSRIQDAVDAASDGQIIDVSPGNYPESVLVNVPNLTLQGAQAGVPVADRSTGDADESTIDGQAGSHAVNITAAGVSVDGFTVTTTTGTTMGIGETTALVGTEVANNFVHGFVNSLGINLAAGSADSRIEGNQLSDVYAGIYLSANATDATLSGNHIEGLAPGAGPDQGAAIVFEGSNSDVSVTGNTLSDNVFGLYVWDGYGSDFNGTLVTGNDFAGNASGLTNTNPALIEATCNWWGSSYGPSGEGPGFGASVDGNVLFEPWNSSLGGDCDGQFIQPDYVYVDDDYAGLPPGTAVTFTLADSSTVNATVGYDAFAALADGISAVANSGTVLMASGDYPGGRLVIDKNLQIEGVGDKPVIRPNQDMTGSAASNAWILVEEGSHLNLVNVVLDGNSHLVHYALRSHGEVVLLVGVDVRNIRGSLSGSPYQGVGIASFGGDVAGGAGAGTYSETLLIITESSFEQIGRIAVLVKGSGSEGVIVDNVFNGKGDGDFLDYAVEVGAEGSAVIVGNTISGNRGIASSDGSTSAGIMVTSFYGNSASEAIIVDNNLVDNSHGIAVGYGDNDDNDVLIADNNFIGNRYQLSVSYNDFALVEDTLADNDFDRTVVVRDNPIDLALAVPVIYSRIQDAVDAASDGQIVDVSPGNYPESVLVNVPNLTLQGAQAGVPVADRSAGDVDESTIDGQAGSHAVNIAAAGVSVDGFTVTTTAGTTMGIGETTTLVGTEVANNFVHGFVNSLGITLAAGSADSRIEDNQLSDVYAGIYLSANATDATLSGNHIEGLAAGAGPDQGAAIVFEGNNSDVSVTGNTLSDNAFGLYVWDGYGSDFNGTLVTGNDITGNVSGVTNTNPALIDATCNWWGHETGPGSVGFGDPIDGNVSFEPWNIESGGPCTGTTVLLQGTVSTLGYCSDHPAPLEGALIEVEGSLGSSLSASSDGNGFYQFVVNMFESPLDLTVSYPNHATESFQVTYTGGGTINGNAALVLAEPCATILPESLSINLDAGSSTVGQIDLGNVNGAAPLIWSIDTANALADQLRPDPAEAISGEREPATDHAVISSGTVRLTQAELAEFVQPVLESGPTLSVDGMTAGDVYGSGDPDNSFVNLNIGVGNALIGIGWEVTVEAFAPSWLDDSRLAIVTSEGDSSGLFLAPAVGMFGPGVTDSSSGGLLMLADASIPPVEADSDGNLYLEWFETWADFSGAPDSLWMNSANPQVTLPGLRLICEDQAACDAAVGGDTVVHCLDPVGIPWLHPEPIFGMTAAGEVTNINLTLDASTLQPGEYHAGLCVASNDPVNPLLSMPVSLNVRIAEGSYNFAGTVQSLGHCGENPVPLEGARLQVTGSAGNQIFYTEADGSYDLYLPSDEAPYSITVTHAGLLGDSETGLNADAVVDFDLVLDAPCINTDPDSVSSILLTDSSTTAEVTISNLGAATLDWQLDENPASAGLLLRTASATVPETLTAEGFDGLSHSAHGEAGRMVLMPSADNTLNEGEIVLTHSASQDIVFLNTVVCSSDNGASTLENVFLRTFTLGDFGISMDFDVSEVSFGIEELSLATSVDVNLYTLDGVFNYANMTLIGTTSAALEPSQSETVVTVPVSGAVPAGGTLVVEIVAPDLDGVGRFYPGSNTAGETAPSYLVSADCGLHEPTPYSAIGFSNVHLVMNVIGSVSLDCDIPDWISSMAPASGSLMPSASEPLTLTLDSTGLTPDTYTANVCLSSNDTFEPVTIIPVELEVLARDPAELVVDPVALDFGEVPVGSYASLGFTVSNQAGPEAEALTLDILGVADGTDFSISGGDCAADTVLNPGESCLVEVSFMPSLAGALSDQAEVIAGSQQALVDLAGTGVVLEPGTLQFDQTELHFGSVSLGQTVTQTLTLSNAAPGDHAPVELASIGVLVGSDFADTGNGSCQAGVTALAPGESCTVEISFSPTATGDLADLLLAEGSEGEVASTELKGSGTEEPAEDAIFSDRFEVASSGG